MRAFKAHLLVLLVPKAAVRFRLMPATTTPGSANRRLLRGRLGWRRQNCAGISTARSDEGDCGGPGQAQKGAGPYLGGTVCSEIHRPSYSSPRLTRRPLYSYRLHLDTRLPILVHKELSLKDKNGGMGFTVLIIGAGLSRVAEQLYEKGLRRITCMDSCSQVWMWVACTELMVPELNRNSCCEVQ